MDDKSVPSGFDSSYLSPMQSYGSSIVSMTNPEDELFKMELTLRGQILDKDGNVKQAGEPLLNEEGINNVIGTVQTLVNRISVMSNFNKYEVPMLIDFLGDTLAVDLMLNRVRYGIKNVAVRNKIFFTVLSTSFVTLKRGFEEGEKRFWKGSQQEITTTVRNAAQGKGLFRSLFGWKK